MKNLVLLFYILFCSSLVAGNYSKSLGSENDTTKYNLLCIVKQTKNNKTITTFNLGLNMKHVTKLHIVNKDSVKQEYKDMGAVMVMELTLNPSIELINLKKFFDKRHVPAQKRKLPVYLGNSLVNGKTDVWLNEQDVKNFTVGDSKISIEILNEVDKKK